MACSHLTKDLSLAYSHLNRWTQFTFSVHSQGPQPQFPLWCGKRFSFCFTFGFILLDFINVNNVNCYSAAIRKLSSMPTALRMPTNESKACSKQTKRVWYQILRRWHSPYHSPGTTLTKWPPWVHCHNVRALSRVGRWILEEKHAAMSWLSP